MSMISLPEHVPVLIAGGGPVGLTAAALLARFNIPSIVIEADTDYCEGSRAICMSRRSQEILSWIGADKALVDKGLSWVGGRSYWRNIEVLHFEMPHEPTQRYAPMVNIQQYYLEQFIHQALEQSQPNSVYWGHKVLDVQQTATAAQVLIQLPEGNTQTVTADWVIACDGGRSTVREVLGLALKGMQYDGRYVIVDIKQKTQRPVERLAWFDPPSNPNSTLLMHRQPDEVWRIDYQIRPDEDPLEAVKPENVLPRIQSHLAMIGETEPWEVLWISLYNAKCLSLENYRHGRVFFAGDAAHLVPIFGVRGLNSGLDDVSSLVWKLASVCQGTAADSVLDSYSIGRVAATQENIAYGAKSTEFMAPPNRAFELMREAALRLAVVDKSVASLINPRQSTPIVYSTSPLNIVAQDQWFSTLAQAGAPAPEALLTDERGQPRYLTEYFGKEWVLIVFSQPALTTTLRQTLLNLPWQVVIVGAEGLHDTYQQVQERYGFAEGEQGLILVRPDGYILGRWSGLALDTCVNAWQNKGF
ncbi:MAG: hypothetical protein RLZZ422_1018 [Pseudomonadota bacterium]|jgi:3-(3-hydroxy-phenyl)propionate hydroxylase